MASRDDKGSNISDPGNADAPVPWRPEVVDPSRKIFQQQHLSAQKNEEVGKRTVMKSQTGSLPHTTVKSSYSEKVQPASRMSVTSCITPLPPFSQVTVPLPRMDKPITVRKPVDDKVQTIKASDPAVTVSSVGQMQLVQACQDVIPHGEEVGLQNQTVQSEQQTLSRQNVAQGQMPHWNVQNRLLELSVHQSQSGTVMQQNPNRGSLEPNSNDPSLHHTLNRSNLHQNPSGTGVQTNQTGAAPHNALSGVILHQTQSVINIQPEHSRASMHQGQHVQSLQQNQGKEGIQLHSLQQVLQSSRMATDERMNVQVQKAGQNVPHVVPVEHKKVGMFLQRTEDQGPSSGHDQRQDHISVIQGSLRSGAQAPNVVMTPSTTPHGQTKELNSGPKYLSQMQVVTQLNPLQSHNGPLLAFQNNSPLIVQSSSRPLVVPPASRATQLPGVNQLLLQSSTGLTVYPYHTPVGSITSHTQVRSPGKTGFSRTYDRPQSHQGLVRPVASPAQNTNNANRSVNGGQISSFKQKAGSFPNQLLQGKSTETSRAHVQLIIGPEVISSSRVHKGSLQPHKGKHVLPEPKIADVPKVVKYGTDQLTPQGQNNEGFPNKKMNENIVVSMPVPQTSNRNSATVTGTSQSAQIIAPLGLPAKRLTEEQIRAELAKSQLDLQRAKNELYQYFEHKSASSSSSVIYQAAINTPAIISPVVSNTNVLNTKRPSVPLPQVSHFVSPPPPMKSLTVLYQAADAQSVDQSPVTTAAVQATDTSVKVSNNTVGMTYMGNESSVHQNARSAVLPQQPVSNAIAAQAHLSTAAVPHPPVSVPAHVQLPVITVAGPLPVLTNVSVPQPVTRIVPVPESLSRSEAVAHCQIQDQQTPAKTILSHLLTGTQSSNQADGVTSLATNTTITMQNQAAVFSDGQTCNVGNENHSVPANNSFDQRQVATTRSQSQSTPNVPMISSTVTNMNPRNGQEGPTPEKDHRLDQLETQGSAKIDSDLNAQRNKKFTVSYKLEAVQYAKQTSKSEASRKYGVNQRQITQWCQQEEKLHNLLKDDQGNRMRSPGGGRKLLFSSLDKRLLEWLHDYRRDSNRVTAKAIMLKAKEIHEESGEESQKFVASNGWFQRFLLRNNLTLKQLNDPDFVLPIEVEKTTDHQLSITSATPSVEDSNTPVWPEHAVDMLVEAASVVSQGTTEASEIVGPAMYIVTPDTVTTSSADQGMDEKSMDQLTNEEIIEISPRRSGSKQGLKKSSCFHKSYTISFKLEAVKYAKQTTKETAARKFKVNSKQIRDWCKKEERLRKMLNNQEGGRRKLTGCGRKAFSHMLEKMLVSWIMQCRRNNLRISRAQIKRKAQEIYQSGMVTDATWENFHASDGWLCKFLWRHRASMKTINSDDPFSNPEPPTKEEPAFTKKITGMDHSTDPGDSDDQATGDHGNKFDKKNTNNPSSTITTKAMVKEMPEGTAVRRSLRAPSKRKINYPMDESASDEEETISVTRKKRMPQVNKVSLVTAVEGEPIREKPVERDNVDTYEEMGAPAVHKAYSVAFKLRAVDHAKHTSKIATAKAFKVDPKQIRHWCQNESQLREALARNEGDRKRMGGGGRKGMGGLLDEKLLKWIKQCKEEDTFISSSLIRQKALAILQECKEGVTSDIKFSASQGWLKNFLARNKLSLHQLSAADIGEESVEGQGQSDSQGQADNQGQDEKEDDTTVSPVGEAAVSAVSDNSVVPSHNLRRRTKMRLTQKMISDEKDELDEEQLSPVDDIEENIKYELKAKGSSEESSKMNEILSEPPTDLGSTRYKKYNVYYKLEAVEFARKHSKSAAAKRYKVDMKRIREWCKDEDKLRALLTKNEGFRTRTVGAGRKGVGSCLDEKLLAWMDQCYKENVKFTGAMICKKALEIYASMEGDTPVKEFTASKGWLARFLMRHKISLRPKGSQPKKQDSQKIMQTTQPVVAECSEGSLQSPSPGTVSVTGTEDPKPALYSTQSYIGEVYYVSPMQASSSSDTYTTASHMYQAPPTSCSDSVGDHPQFARDVYNSDDSHPLTVYRNLHNADTNPLGSYTNMQNMETQNVLPNAPQHPADGLAMNMPTQVFNMVEPSSSMQNANHLTNEPPHVMQQNTTQHQMEPPNSMHDTTRPGTDPQSVNSDEAPTYANLHPHDPRPPVTDNRHLPPGPSPHQTEDVNSRQEYGQENYNDMVQRHAEDEIRQWVLGYMAQMANLSTQQTPGNYSASYQQ